MEGPFKSVTGEEGGVGGNIEKPTFGHCEAHVRRGNLFNNQCVMRLLRRPQASSQ